MHVAPEYGNAKYTIKSYTDHSITINEQEYTKSLILSTETMLELEDLHCIDDLSQTELNILKELEPELILIGTGTQQVFLTPLLMEFMSQHKIGIEIMTTPAACRTYNVLSAEGRKVAAILLIESF